MRPAFTVSIDGADRTAVLRRRLLKLHVTDSTGHDADELELEFDDRGSALALPRKGAVADVTIGYVGQALVRAGSFVVDQVEIRGPQRLLVVKARSADMRASLKAHRSAAHRGTTLGQLAQTIASAHGLTAVVNPALASIAIAHRDQTGESDLHFVTRLARDHDAIALVKGGKLIITPKGQAVAGSGKALPALGLGLPDLLDWSMRDGDREKYGKVRATAWDPVAASAVQVEAGSSEPTQTLRHSYASPALATHAAHAAHRRGKRKGHTLELSLPGRPSLFAGAAIAVVGVREGIDGRWICSKVEHELDFGSVGYTTKIEATVDGRSADQDGATVGYGGDAADPADEDGDGE